MEDASGAGGGTDGQSFGGAVSDEALAASLAADQDATGAVKRQKLDDGGGVAHTSRSGHGHGGGGTFSVGFNGGFRPPLEIMHKGDFLR
jgi:hypothetical protein